MLDAFPALSHAITFRVVLSGILKGDSYRWPVLQDSVSTSNRYFMYASELEVRVILRVPV